MKLFKQNKESEETVVAGATEMLREDHRKVKEIFDEFEHTEDSATKKKLVEKGIIELTVHATLEEELFYPAVRRETEEEDVMDEAEEEHHIAKILIGELARMKPSDPRYDAKFKVLAESVRHHIEEEEGEILPKIEQSGFDLETLGQEMGERKMLLMEQVDLGMIRRESSGEVAALKPGGRRSRRSARGSKGRRVSSRTRTRSKASSRA